MTPEELKGELSGLNLPTSFKLSKWENIVDVNGFLDTSFDIVEAWSRGLDSCPAWERLLRFYEAIKKPGTLPG